MNTSKLKKLIILRGIPSSGKSTTAKLLSDANPYNDTKISSTDDFFMSYNIKDKYWEYKFDGSKLNEYHKYNLQNTIYSMCLGYSQVIVDNTNIRFVDFKLYVLAAIIIGYEIELIEPETEWRYNVEECYRRNKHGVPLENIQKMRDRWETTETCYAKIEFLKNTLKEIK